MNTVAHIEIDSSAIHEQVAEATQLLQQIPEGRRDYFAQMLLQGIATVGFEFGERTQSTAAGTGEILICYRPRIVDGFERLVAAMRAEKPDVA